MAATAAFDRLSFGAATGKACPFSNARRIMKPLSLSVFLVLILSGAVASQDWAIDGFDPVDTIEGRPGPGRGDIATLWKGQVWNFATEENRSRFEADPRSFAPAFDGLCPVDLAQGKRVPGDPRHSVVIDGRLYLPHSARAAMQLLRDPDLILLKARQGWPQ